MALRVIHREIVYGAVIKARHKAVIYVIFEAFWKKSNVLLEKRESGFLFCTALIGLFVGFLLREGGFLFCTALIGLLVGFLLGVVGLSHLMSVTSPLVLCCVVLCYLVLT